MIIVDKIRELFGQKKKPPLRDKHGRPYYLVKVPIHKRHPRAFVTIGTTVSLLILFSRPIYDIFFRTPSSLDQEEEFWWNSERQRGIRQIDLLRQRRIANDGVLDFKDAFKPYVAHEHKQLMEDFYERTGANKTIE